MLLVVFCNMMFVITVFSNMGRYRTTCPPPPQVLSSTYIKILSYLNCRQFECVGPRSEIQAGKGSHFHLF